MMKKFLVSYSENVIRNIVVKAHDAEEAEEMVMDGDVDYDDSVEVDATVVSINSSEPTDD